MKKHDMIIGIDPDVDKSGVAELNISTREVEWFLLTFPLLIDYLRSIRKKHLQKESVLVVVEAGWLNKKSCFHDAQGRKAEKVAKDVGANHETGRKIIEMARHYGFEVVEAPPLLKCWKGHGGKITHEELSCFTNIKGKTNQDVRDAILLAWVHGGLPITTKPKLAKT